MTASARKFALSALAALLCSAFALALSAAAPCKALAEEPPVLEAGLIAQNDSTPTDTDNDNCLWTIDDSGVLTVSPKSGNTGELIDWGNDPEGAPWYAYRDRIMSVNFTGTITASTCCYMFAGCTNLISVNLTGLNTSGTQNFSCMFKGCSSLSRLNLSPLNTASANKLFGLLEGCSSLSSLTLWTTSTQSVTNMDNMFYGCSSLISLNLSALNTTNVTTMESMFHGCSSLTSLTPWSTSVKSGTSMKDLFYGCTMLANLDLSNFKTSNVTNMEGLFRNCSSLINLNLTGLDTSNVTNMTSMFSGCSRLTSLNLAGFNTENVTSMDSMFKDCESLSGISVDSSFSTANVTNMNSMYEGCAALESLDLSGYNASSVTQTSSMFKGCTSLTTLTLWENKTAEITSTQSMFEGCSALATLNNLTSIDMYVAPSAQIDTVYVSMSSMFKGCSSLASLDVSHLKTPTDPSGVRLSSFPKVSEMFSGCRSLKSLKLFVLDTSKYTDSLSQPYLSYKMDSMFKGCSSLEMLDLTAFNTKKVTHMNSVFEGCTSLKTIFVGDEWSTTNTSNSHSANMFLGCAQLVGDVGTTYDANNITAAYAHIDAVGSPGYFKDAFDLKWATVTFLRSEYPYTGDEIRPSDMRPSELTVSLGDKPLTEHTDYMVEYKNHKQVGTATATIVPNTDSGYQEYHGSTSATFEIVKADATITIDNKSKNFGERDPELTATVVGDTIYSHVNYTLTREEGEDAHTYAITAVLGNNPGYNVTVVPGTFTINKGPSSAIGLSVIGYNAAYDGETHYASATTTAEGSTIKYSTDGGTTWNDQIPSIKDVGEVAFKVKASNDNCDGEQVADGTLKVTPASIEDAALVLSQADFTYNGAVQKPTVKTVDGKALVAGTDYDLVYSDTNSKAVGSYTVKVEGKNYCAGTSKTATYKIAPKQVTVTAQPASKTYGTADPSLSAAVTGTVGSDTVTYAVSRATGEDAGTYAITPSGAANQGNYAVSFTPASFTITQAANSATVAKSSVRKTVKASAVKKKAKTIALPKVATTYGDAVWKQVKKDKKRVLSLKAGKIKVKKGAKKGTYTIKVMALVPESGNYMGAATNVVTVKVKIK